MGSLCVSVGVCSGSSHFVHGGSLYVSFSSSVLSTCVLLLVFASMGVNQMCGVLVYSGVLSRCN